MNRASCLLTLGAVLFAGCIGEPYDGYTVGPVPKVALEQTIERKRVLVKRPAPFYRGWETQWVLEGKAVIPRERLAPLKLLIPESLHQRLNETFKYQVGPEFEEFDREKNFAQAYLVSLNPDVLIITVRSYQPPESLNTHLFEETQTGAPNWRAIEQKLELIDADSITLVYFAGEICTWSEEMYVLSPHESIAFRRLDPEGERCEIDFGLGKLVLTKEDTFATVERIERQ